MEPIKEKNTVLRDGKKPISSKRKPVETVLFDDVFASALSLDAELASELEQKGLVPRFVDAKRMSEMGGYNEKGWQIYRREKRAADSINPSDFKFGNDPSGIIRRGSLVLAVKTKEKAAMHRKYLNQKAANQEQVQKQAASELRNFARQNGLDTMIHEGYEENESPGI